MTLMTFMRGFQYMTDDGLRLTFFGIADDRERLALALRWVDSQGDGLLAFFLGSSLSLFVVNDNEFLAFFGADQFIDELAGLTILLVEDSVLLTGLALDRDRALGNG